MVTYYNMKVSGVSPSLLAAFSLKRAFLEKTVFLARSLFQAKPLFEMRVFLMAFSNALGGRARLAESFDSGDPAAEICRRKSSSENQVAKIWQRRPGGAISLWQSVKRNFSICIRRLSLWLEGLNAANIRANHPPKSKLAGSKLLDPSLFTQASKLLANILPGSLPRRISPSARSLSPRLPSPSPSGQLPSRSRPAEKSGALFGESLKLALGLLWIEALGQSVGRNLRPVPKQVFEQGRQLGERRFGRPRYCVFLKISTYMLIFSPDKGSRSRTRFGYQIKLKVTRFRSEPVLRIRSSQPV